jgi:hypothetical protein
METVLKREEIAGGQRKLHGERLRNFYLSEIIRVMKQGERDR